MIYEQLDSQYCRDCEFEKSNQERKEIIYQHLVDIIISWSLMGFKQAENESALANQLAKIQSQPIKLK
jgi:hypothetical protein